MKLACIHMCACACAHNQKKKFTKKIFFDQIFFHQKTQKMFLTKKKYIFDKTNFF